MTIPSDDIAAESLGFLAIEFAAQPESLPVFKAWLARRSAERGVAADATAGLHLLDSRSMMMLARNLAGRQVTPLVKRRLTGG